ncbi:hypothetical protein [Glaciihabitans sp. UYNi722]|uniref:hypothetical protein n=1 Tax=Glaciihabitans sp. UYNi722 TaxID=3156344 RepID=UPI0033917983
MRQFRDFDNILPIIVGLGFGLIAIAAGTRGAQRRADQAAASAPAVGTAASTATTIAPGGAPRTNTTPPAPPAGQTLLNGEPIDPNASN